MPGRVDPLDPFILNGFTSSFRVTRENSRVYLLEPFIETGRVWVYVIRVIRVVNKSCWVTHFASPNYFITSVIMII